MGSDDQAARRAPARGTDPADGRDVRSLRWRRPRGEDGNTLVLFPAAVLILLGLGGVALDAATIYLGQRRLADLAAAVATDAVAAVDHDAFFGDRRLALSTDRAALRRTQLLTSHSEDRGFGSVDCEVLVAADPARATAVCTAQVRPLFAPLVPGMGAAEPIRAVETAVAVQR